MIESFHNLSVQLLSKSDDSIFKNFDSITLKQLVRNTNIYETKILI